MQDFSRDVFVRRVPFRYTTEMPLDLPFAYRQSESRTPIVLLYTQEANMVEKLVIEGAQKKQVCKQPRSQDLSSNCPRRSQPRSQGRSR